MQLKSLSIQNYRGAKLAEKIPLKSMTVFVGKNDSGKSIALNAVATLLDIKEYPILDLDFHDMDSPIVLDGYFSSDNLKDVISKKIGAKIKKDEGKDEFIDDICTHDELAIRRVVNKPGKAYDETLIRIRDYDHEDFSALYQKSDEEIVTIIEKYDITIPVSGRGRNSKLEKTKHIKQYCADNGIEEKYSWINDDYDISKLLPAVELFKSDYGIEADTAFKTVSVTEIKNVLDQESTEGGKLASVAQKVELEMGKESAAIANLMQEYASDVKSVTISPSFTWKDAIKSVAVNFELEGDDKPINMTRKGSGYRRIFMVARFRYLAQKKKGNDVVYIIEEPETFLHPSAQEDLLNALIQLSSENQVLLATHSPVFAGSSDKSAVILSEKTSSGSKYVSEADDVNIPQRIIEELGIKPRYNLRDTYTKILFCESRNDIEFYDIITKTLLGKTIIGNPDILALPGGGDSLEDIISIDYFSKSERSLYLIADSDKHRDESVQAKNKERVERFKTYKNANGYLLKKACIENYYHPRAFERIYNLPQNSRNIHADDDNVKSILKKVMEDTGIQITLKNDHRVFTETKKAEWEEIIEDDLITFLKALAL